MMRRADYRRRRRSANLRYRAPRYENRPRPAGWLPRPCVTASTPPCLSSRDSAGMRRLSRSMWNRSPSIRPLSPESGPPRFGATRTRRSPDPRSASSS
ncbi:RRXRR domain-containing protein [Streptomyces sp. MS1.HAVA.3]|uniref:RRXRR domain-containing protein n=1 Tax=Streptomyces caledonius TaxID=3134107 RepID=A0ABU8U7G0_9ACTN